MKNLLAAFIVIVLGSFSYAQTEAASSTNEAQSVSGEQTQTAPAQVEKKKSAAKKHKKKSHKKKKKHKSNH